MMKSKTILLLPALLIWLASFSFRVPQEATGDLVKAKGQWEIDNEKSTMQFNIKTLWIFPVKGTMGGMQGKIDITDDLSTCYVQLKLKTKTIDTGNDKRDHHLRSEDFFEVEKYPEINFKSNDFHENDGEYPYAVTGKLTIKDVTKEMIVPFRFEGIEKIEGKEYARFKGEVEVNRFDFDIDYSGSKARTMGDVATLNFTILAKRL